MTLTEQFSAILAVPIGGAVLAFGLCFFGLMAGLVKHVIEQRAQRMRSLRDLAARFPGAAYDD